ncbi:interferon gamma [Rhineura floridana]|uniref:interferon gamma n=1 Tax=Rhineura floridana TaxID=261503 RepID=UPI002AC8886D|nr:interferon gamma [Rhineura floridana]
MVWKICLFILLAISSSDGHVPTGSLFEDMKEHISKLEKYFNTSHPDVAEGGSIFTGRLQNGLWSQINEKKILLAQMISIYWEMLNNLNNTQNPKDIRSLVEVLQVYKMNYSESLKKAKDLIEIAKLPMNDAKIQRKAVAEFYDVMLEVNKEESQRKRRSRRLNRRPGLLSGGRAGYKSNNK